jgi:cyclopropane fatty-acyl-phospholipid synthase-like methyltransferase
MNLLGARTARDYIAQEINAAPGDRVLDIGCGNATILKHLPEVSYFGVDSNPNYISKARETFGAKGNFRCVSVDDLAFEFTGKFDRVLLLGVLHHLTDQQIKSLMLIIKELLSENGRLITHDGVFIAKQNSIARLLLKLDRGRYVRTEKEYLSLLSTELTVGSTQVRNDFLRIPYSVLFTNSMVKQEN